MNEQNKKIVEDYKKTRSVTKVAKLNNIPYLKAYLILYRYKLIKPKLKTTRILKKTTNNQFITNISTTLLNKSNIFNVDKIKLEFKPANNKLLIEVKKYE